MKELTAYSIEGNEKKLRALLVKKGYYIFEDDSIVVQNNQYTPGKFVAIIYHNTFPRLSCVVLHHDDSRLKKLLEDFNG